MSNADVPFKGLTVEQVESILEQIALAADVLVQHTIDAAQHVDNPNQKRTFWIGAPVARESAAPARLSDMEAFARRLKSNRNLARDFFREAGILGQDGI